MWIGFGAALAYLVIYVFNLLPLTSNDVACLSIVVIASVLLEQWSIQRQKNAILKDLDVLKRELEKVFDGQTT